MLRLLKSSVIVLATILSLHFCLNVWADASSDLADLVDQELQETGESGEVTELSPENLLPLAPSNTSLFEFTAGSTAGTDVGLSLGDLVQGGGNVCYQPLVFDDEQLTLYIVNYNTHIVLYGVELVVDGDLRTFLFIDGSVVNQSSGILLADNSEDDLSESLESGVALIDGSVIPWEVTSKLVESKDSNKSFTGLVAGEATMVESEQIRESSFRLNLSDSVFVGVDLEFTPGIGLTSASYDLGGGTTYKYDLIVSPTSSFDIEDSVNTGRFDCGGEAENTSISRESSGYITNWFIFSLLFVVLLRASKFYRNSSFGNIVSKRDRFYKSPDL